MSCRACPCVQRDSSCRTPIRPRPDRRPISSFLRGRSSSLRRPSRPPGFGRTRKRGLRSEATWARANPLLRPHWGSKKGRRGRRRRSWPPLRSLALPARGANSRTGRIPLISLRSTWASSLPAPPMYDVASPPPPPLPLARPYSAATDSPRRPTTCGRHHTKMGRIRVRPEDGRILPSRRGRRASLDKAMERRFLHAPPFALCPPPQARVLARPCMAREPHSWGGGCRLSLQR